MAQGQVGAHIASFQAWSGLAYPRGPAGDQPQASTLYTRFDEPSSLGLAQPQGPLFHPLIHGSTQTL